MSPRAGCSGDGRLRRAWTGGTAAGGAGPGAAGSGRGADSGTTAGGSSAGMDGASLVACRAPGGCGGGGCAAKRAATAAARASYRSAHSLYAASTTATSLCTLAPRRLTLCSETSHCLQKVHRASQQEVPIHRAALAGLSARQQCMHTLRMRRMTRERCNAAAHHSQVGG